MRCALLFVALSACAAGPTPPPATAPAVAASDVRVGCADVRSVVGRIAYVRDDATANWLEIDAVGPSCDAMRACERLVAAEMGHALPPGFSASVQQRCDTRATDRAALSALPYELADLDVVETGNVTVQASYVWIERFAYSSECEASRAAHEQRRTREDLEMKKSLGAPPSASSAAPSTLLCRRVGAR